MRRETKGWLDKAEEDFSTARDCLASRHFDASAFHAQQAAEKSLKALQIQLHGRFDKIHDLVSLAKALDAPNEVINCCLRLAPYYVITRYPDVGEPITKNIVKELLDDSMKVVKWVTQRL
ncbi:MAG: HEPN domain-containing protein [Thaumarchaeota archaeon]|nr:HEPN domain-containing protein [Nitrososphaerota archaeon]